MIPKGEIGCKICEKSSYRIFVEHIRQHLEEEEQREDKLIPLPKIKTEMKEKTWKDLDLLAKQALKKEFEIVLK